MGLFGQSNESKTVHSVLSDMVCMAEMKRNCVRIFSCNTPKDSLNYLYCYPSVHTVLLEVL